MKAKNNVRLAKLNDVDIIYEIEQASFSDPWSKAQIIADINNGNRLFLCIENLAQIVVGYIVLNKVVDFAEILRFAIKNDERRQGKGELLFECAKTILHKDSYNRINLEVREKNMSAISFYKKMGFQTDGVRNNYYSDGESALLMSINI